jgi:hypothetical protein
VPGRFVGRLLFVPPREAIHAIKREIIRADSIESFVCPAANESASTLMLAREPNYNLETINRF